ncbi:MAG: exo-alpha-sialidase [Dongiaceae bacterium]
MRACRRRSAAAAQRHPELPDRPAEVARRDGSEFEEPSLVQLPSGRLLMLMRDNGTRRLHQCTSDDAGHSWSAPARLPIDGYPPHLLQLPDGRILCTIGWRYPDFGIRAVLSNDGGETWEVDRTIRIRGGLPDKDLGYPCTILDGDGSLFTVYYGQDGDGVTCIMATRWRLQGRAPLAPTSALAAKPSASPPTASGHP